MNSKKVAITGLLLALAIIAGVLESFIPPIIPVLPYAKLGLSNVFIICSLLMLGTSPALIVVVLKCILVSIAIANFNALFYSLPASCISFLIMLLLYKFKIFSLAGISCIAGGVHNIIQIFVACIFMQSSIPLTYIPFLTAFGMLSGVLSGTISYYILKKLPAKFFNVGKKSGAN